jgi:hypothetical protein
MPSESLSKYVRILFKGRREPHVDDPLMEYISYVVHMDLYMLCPLSLQWVFAKIESTLVVTPNDSRSMELDSQCLDGNVNYSSVLSL